MSGDGEVKPRTGGGIIRLLAWLLLLLAVLSWAPGYLYDPYSDDVTNPYDKVWGASFFAFPLVGVFLARRIPSNPVGWLFIVGPGLVGGGVSAMEASQALDLPGLEVFESTLFGLGVLAMFASILLFPDGRYPHRWFAILHLAALAAVPTSVLLLPEDEGGVALSLNLTVSLAALTYRLVRGDSTTRRQIAGPLLVALMGLAASTLVGVLARGLGWESEALSVVPILFFTVGIPISIAIAILRYRLYDIDLVINRTLVYGTLTVLLGTVYVAGVVGLPRLLPLTEDNDLVVAGSTLAVAALFSPARRRIQGMVDRRFYRRRYDARRTVEAFGSRLRDQVDLETLVEDLQGVVRDTLAPASVGVWLRASETKQ